MKKLRFYTLVELLVVVAVAALILGIATPAFTAMMKGGAMTASTRELSAKIKATASYAVANNCYTALLFPTGSELSATGKNALYFRCYRPCVVYNDSGWQFESWIEGEQWHFMNRGILIGNADADFTNGVEVQSVPVGTVNRPTDTASSNVARAIIFKPNGQLADVPTGNSVTIRLAEGVATAANAVTFTNKSGSSVPYQVFTINPLSGKIGFSSVEE